MTQFSNAFDTMVQPHDLSEQMQLSIDLLNEVFSLSFLFSQ
jgi:hypothetical protein